MRVLVLVVAVLVAVVVGVAQQVQVLVVCSPGTMRQVPQKLKPPLSSIGQALAETAMLILSKV